jgi:hypothetical protein
MAAVVQFPQELRDLWSRISGAVTSAYQPNESPLDELGAPDFAKVDPEVRAQIAETLSPLVFPPTPEDAASQGFMGLGPANINETRVPSLIKFFDDIKQQNPLTLYHGTTSEAAKQILNKGFDPSFYGHNHGRMFGGGVYLTPDPKQASYWGPSQVKVRVPPSQVLPIRLEDYQKQFDNWFSKKPVIDPRTENQFLALDNPPLDWWSHEWLGDLGGDQVVMRNPKVLQPIGIENQPFERVRARTSSQINWDDLFNRLIER